MRAISMPRTSRTVIEATTSPRASFSLTWLRSTPAPAAVAWSELGFGMVADMIRLARYGQTEGRRRDELFDRFQAHPQRGVGAGMADPAGPRRLLSPRRSVWHDRPDLQPHHRAYSRHRASSDQPVRPALQGDYRLERSEEHT